MILYLALGLEEGLLGKNTEWHKERWNKGTAIENDQCKLCWNLEYDLRKTPSADDQM